MTTKRITKVFALALGFAFIFSLLAGCSSTPENTNTIKVGACAGPYEDMFREAIEPSLVEKGYTVEYVQFSDYVQPNKALAEGEIDVNIFQHSIYLESFAKEYDLDLAPVTEVPTAGMGIFSNNFQSLSDIPEGAQVAIPNDVTNLARAIQVLEQAGLVKIDPSIDPSEASQYTLAENPKNLNFVEVEAPQLPRSLEGTDLAVINGNYALGAGLDLSDALYNEELKDGYVNVIAVRTTDENEAFVKDIDSVVHSDAFRNVIEDSSKQYSSFFKPNNYKD